MEKLALQELFAALTDEAHDKSCPASLVRGAQAFTGFAMEVFVEEQQVLPIWIVGIALGKLIVSKAGAIAFFVFFEERNKAVTDVDGDFPQGAF